MGAGPTETQIIQNEILVQGSVNGFTSLNDEQIITVAFPISDVNVKIAEDTTAMATPGDLHNLLTTRGEGRITANGWTSVLVVSPYKWEKPDSTHSDIVRNGDLVLGIDIASHMVAYRKESEKRTWGRNPREKLTVALGEDLSVLAQRLNEMDKKEDVVITCMTHAAIVDILTEIFPEAMQSAEVVDLTQGDQVILEEARHKLAESMAHAGAFTHEDADVGLINPRVVTIKAVDLIQGMNIGATV